ncbi:hypothetical protein [Thermopirellula anaerolimosa]|jgi:hypothetical protein
MTVTHWHSPELPEEPELPDDPDELLPLEPLLELPELDPDDPLLELLDDPEELLEDDELLDELPEEEELLPEDEEPLLDEDELLELLDELELLVGRQQSYSFSYWNQYSIRASGLVPKRISFIRTIAPMPAGRSRQHDEPSLPLEDEGHPPSQHCSPARRQHSSR